MLGISCQCGIVIDYTNTDTTLGKYFKNMPSWSTEIGAVTYLNVKAPVYKQL